MVLKLLLERTIPPAAGSSLYGKSYLPVPIPADIQFLRSALAFRQPPHETDCKTEKQGHETD
jgi:hypothetical protein